MERPEPRLSYHLQLQIGEKGVDYWKKPRELVLFFSELFDPAERDKAIDYFGGEEYGKLLRVSYSKLP